VADQVIDVTIENHGTLMVVRGMTGIAKAHLEERMPDGVMMWGSGYVVEPRYVDYIVQDLLDHDFTVGAA
jgi:hypothetical protein